MSRILKTMVGDTEVIALTDGTLEFDKSLFPTVDRGELDEALTEAGQATPNGSVNAYVVRAGDTVTLVDSGPRDLFGPTLGFLPRALAEAAIKPEDITQIILTHMHPDHIAGTIDAAGNAVFKNATLRVNADDYAFWMDESIRAQAPENRQGFFDVAKAAAAAYSDRLSMFEGAADLGGSLHALPLPGHTPGHSGFRISSGDAQMILLGDIVHCQDLQLAHPDWGIAFDVDGDQAAAARKKLLDTLATDHILCSGSHFNRPAIGHIVKQGDGFAFHARD